MRPHSAASWSRLPDRKLLDLRLSDLRLRIERSMLAPAVDQLYCELQDRGIPFRPHVWLSDEWFTPDGVPGIAIPFYLAHPRLRELEQRQMLEVEGGTHDWCMRILRHEAGHAIDNAYRLHARRRYRELFGSWHAPYPSSYRPKPYTKNFVIHLDLWYAQAHPAEDFAETFAVWLNPRSSWRTHYAQWPALRKLDYVDGVMDRLQDCPPVVRTRRQTHTLPTLRKTLGEHYASRRERCEREFPRIHHRDLRRLFSDEPGCARRPAAAGFLKTWARELRLMVSRWTGVSPLMIQRSIADMQETAQVMGLRLRKSAARTKADVMMLLAVQTMSFVTAEHHRVEL